MKMSDKIKAIEEAFGRYGLSGSEDDFEKADEAISAARIWAAESDARFEQAREAWGHAHVCTGYAGTARDILDQYFGGDE